jgi:hypothetical protein
MIFVHVCAKPGSKIAMDVIVSRLHSGASKFNRRSETFSNHFPHISEIPLRKHSHLAEFIIGVEICFTS